MNEPLSEQQINKILPLLSAIAKHIASGIAPVREWLENSLPASKGNVDGPALQELELWADILQQAKARISTEASAIQHLQDRGIPEAPAILAVNIASGPPSVMEEPPIADELQALDTLSPTESYHDWLPDHKWHDDLDWKHLPPWVKHNDRFMDMLRQGKEVNSKNVSYKITNRRLMRRLHDDRPALVLEAPREKYHDWLPDHRWHDDVDWNHLPSWIKGNQQSLDDLLTHGKQVDGPYMSYKVVGNRLMRRLHDDRPALVLEAPREKYHDWLPDHRWHDDLDWAHLPSWIKRDSRLLNSLLIHGTQIDGNYVSYKVVGNRIMRRLKDAAPIRISTKRSR